jgi:hypothetical protein
MKAMVIEAHIGMALEVHYYSRTLLQGCQLELITQNINVAGKSSFTYAMRGRATVMPYTVLTYWKEIGIVAEYWDPEYWIVQVNPDVSKQMLGHREEYALIGQVEILAHGVGEEQAPLLQRWWTEWALDNGGQVPPIARWLGRELRQRKPQPTDTSWYQQQLEQHKALPKPYPYLIAQSESTTTPPFNPVDGWKFENAQEHEAWFSSAG